MLTARTVDPHVACQRIKQLSSRLQKHEDPSHLLRDAFSIYTEFHGHKDVSTINAMLTLCFKSKRPDQVLSIWRDIENVHESILNESAFIAYSLLFKCCANSDAIPMDKCLQLLQWIQSSDYRLKIHGVYISKLLTKCMKHSPSIDTLRSIHSFIDSHFIGNVDIFIKTQLINGYGDVGQWESAMAVFHSVDSVEYNEYLISSMMKVYCNHSLHEPALELYDSCGSLFGVITLNDVCHIMALRCCKYLQSLERGLKIINSIESQKRKDSDLNSNSNLNQTLRTLPISLQNSMIDFYGHFGLMDRAERLFHSMKHKDAVTIGSMMTLYLYNHSDPGLKCLEIYDSFYSLIANDDICKVLALRACVIANDLKKGIQIHKEALQQQSSLKSRKTSMDSHLNKQLICFYGHFRDVPASMNVFECIPDAEKEQMHFGAMMKVLIENGHYRQSLAIYDRYCTVDDALNNNNTCKMYAIKSCTYSVNMERGRKIIDTLDLRVTHHLQLKCAMIDFYGHSMNMDTVSALTVFESIADDEMDILPITAMMNAFAANQQYKECLDLFHNITSRYMLRPTVSCFKIIFPVCAAAGWQSVGTSVHDAMCEDVETLWMSSETDIITALISMYGTFGAMERCQAIFAQIREDDPQRYGSEIAIWNAMIEAVASNGDMDGVKEIINTMERETDLVPNCQSFVLWITACSHFGHLDIAADIWKHRIGREEVMFDRYVITSLVDALSRSGFVTKAFEIIIRYEKYSKQKYHESMWTALLTGCKLHERRLLGKWFYDRYFERFNQHKTRLQIE